MNQFYSIRKKFDEDFMNAMNNNVENLAEYKHFLMDPYLESVFNQYNEVKIGSIYFRLLDKNRTLIVGNVDYSKFLITRGQIFNDNFNIDNNIFVFNNGISDLNLIFNETETDVRSTLKPMVFADFKYTLSVNNKIQFHNSSFFDDLAGTSPNYIWTFSTGDEYVGFEPPLMSFNESDFPVSCHLKILNSSSPNSEVSYLLSPLLCSCPVNICINDNVETIDLTNQCNYSSGCTVTWNFGDGTAGSGANVTHTYSKTPISNLSKVFLITGTIYCNGGIECRLHAKFSISTGCNGQKVLIKNFDRREDGFDYRLICQNWVSETILNGSCGSSSESLRKLINTNVYSRFQTRVKTSNQGNVWLNVNNCCIQYNVFNPEFLATGKVTLTANFQQSKRVRYLPNQFWSYHGMFINSSWFNSGQNFLN